MWDQTPLIRVILPVPPQFRQDFGEDRAQTLVSGPPRSPDPGQFLRQGGSFLAMSLARKLIHRGVEVPLELIKSDLVVD